MPWRGHGTSAHTHPYGTRESLGARATSKGVSSEHPGSSRVPPFLFRQSAGEVPEDLAPRGARNPGRPIERRATARDQGMYVGMMIQPLVPGVEHHGHRRSLTDREVPHEHILGHAFGDGGLSLVVGGHGVSLWSAEGNCDVPAWGVSSFQPDYTSPKRKSLQSI